MIYTLKASNKGTLLKILIQSEMNGGQIDNWILHFMIACIHDCQSMFRSNMIESKATEMMDELIKEI